MRPRPAAVHCYCWLLVSLLSLLLLVVVVVVASSSSSLRLKVWEKRRETYRRTVLVLIVVSVFFVYGGAPFSNNNGWRHARGHYCFRCGTPTPVQSWHQAHTATTTATAVKMLPGTQ